MKKSKEKNGTGQFPAGYGQFPYIMVKVGYARYLQLPVHRVSKRSHPSFQGVFISGDNESSPKVKKVHDLEALMEVRERHFMEHQVYFPMCLVEGTNEAIYVDESGVLKESSAIPSGGVLLTGNLEIISMSGRHYQSTPITL